MSFNEKEEEEGGSVRGAYSKRGGGKKERKESSIQAQIVQGSISTWQLDLHFVSRNGVFGEIGSVRAGAILALSKLLVRVVKLPQGKGEKGKGEGEVEV